MRDLAPALIVLEATGGFEITVAAALASAGLPLAVVNPRQIRDFARATGRLAKTDVLDAQIIARFAERILPEPRRAERTRRSARHGIDPEISGAAYAAPDQRGEK
jgi:transposase